MPALWCMALVVALGCLQPSAGFAQPASANLNANPAEVPEPPLPERDPPGGPASPARQASPQPAPPDPRDVRVVSYNVRNYFAPQHWTDDGSGMSSAKSEESITELIRIIRELRPDVLGICEMGPGAHWNDFCKRLVAAGVELPYAEFVEAQDAYRHLALLSRYPIVQRNSQTNLTYTRDGVVETMKRGLLDVTIEPFPGQRLQLIGVHLKSRLPVPGGEALIRRHEAELLRNHLNAALTADPNAKILLYGDFNDTKDNPPIRAIAGPRSGPMHMEDILVADDDGDRWTHYYNREDSYSRVDYFFASPALRPLVVRNDSRIADDSWWLEASDHRPIVCTIRFPETPGSDDAPVADGGPGTTEAAAFRPSAP